MKCTYCGAMIPEEADMGGKIGNRKWCVECWELVEEGAMEREADKAASERGEGMKHKSWSPAIAVVLESLGLPPATPEYQFAPPRKWRMDFAWIDKKIALEIEGGIYTGGRHTRINGFEADCEKYNEAALMGWRVLRVSTGMLSDGRAFALLERAFA